MVQPAQSNFNEAIHVLLIHCFLADTYERSRGLVCSVCDCDIFVIQTYLWSWNMNIDKNVQPQTVTIYSAKL